VLLRKPRTYAEVYNDLDDEVVALFRVLRDPALSDRLLELLRLTPFARSEFKLAYEPTDDMVEQSRRLIIRAFMGFGSNAHASLEKGHRSTGFRSNSSRSGTTPGHDWANYPAILAAVIDRLSGVVIENRPAIELIAQHDREEALFYVDPPYLPETRSPANKYDLKWRMYRHELTRSDHAELLEVLDAVKSMVILSGYADPLYDDRLGHWRRVETAALADGARPRTEVLWLNPACVVALGHGPLFTEAAA
jgi:DNA adenine methylase